METAFQNKSLGLSWSHVVSFLDSHHIIHSKFMKETDERVDGVFWASRFKTVQFICMIHVWFLHLFMKLSREAGVL